MFSKIPASTGAEVRISGNGLRSKGSISLAIERSHRCAIERPWRRQNKRMKRKSSCFIHIVTKCRYLLQQ